MGLQKHHDLADGFLIGPAGGDARDPLGPDAVECSQPLRGGLDDIEDLLTKRLDELLGKMRADASNHAAAEVLLDALEGAGRHDLEEGRPKLPAMLSVVIPSAAGLDELPRLDRCRRAEDGHEVTMASNLDPEDAKAGVRAVEGDTFDQTGQGFAIRGGEVGDHTIRDVLAALKMPWCLPKTSSPLCTRKHRGSPDSPARLVSR